MRGTGRSRAEPRIPTRVLAYSLAVSFALVLLLSLVVSNTCGLCGDVMAVDCEGLDCVHDDLEVGSTHAELVADLRPDGSARFRLRVELAGGDVAGLHSDPARLRRVVEAAMELYSLGIDAGDRSHRLEGDRLVVTFTVDDVADRRAGDVLVVDQFYDPRSEEEVDSKLDRFVVEGPEGSTVAKAPPDAAGRGDALVWTEPVTISRERYAAFDLDGSRNPAETRLATALQYADGRWRGGVAFALVAGLGLALVVDLLVGATVEGRRPLSGPLREAAAAVEDRHRERTGVRAGTRSPPERDGDPGEGWPPVTVDSPGARVVLRVGAVVVALSVAVVALATDQPAVRPFLDAAVLFPALPVALFGALGLAGVRAPRTVPRITVLLGCSGALAGATAVFTDPGLASVGGGLVWTAGTAALGTLLYLVVRWLAGITIGDPGPVGA